MSDKMDDIIREPDVRRCLIIYHDDPDGKLSAAIAYRMLKNYCEVDFLETNYHLSINIHNPTQYETCYVLDFCPDMDTMRGLAAVFNNKNLVWIDHHESQRDIWEKFPNVKGFRDSSFTGCEHTWRYFHDMYEMPWFVKLVADRDVWRLEDPHASFGFHEAQIGEDTRPDGEFWGKLFSLLEVNEHALLSYMGDLINQGNLFRSKRLSLVKQIIERSAYMSSIDDHPCIKMNYNDRASASDAMVLMMEHANVPIAWTFYLTKVGNDFVYVNSLRSDGTVDVSEISKKRGGGGHPNASGWSIKIPYHKEL